MNEVSRGHEKFLIPERAKTTGLRGPVHLRRHVNFPGTQRQFSSHDLGTRLACKPIDRFS